MTTPNEPRIEQIAREALGITSPSPSAPPPAPGAATPTAPESAQTLELIADPEETAAIADTSSEAFKLNVIKGPQIKRPPCPHAPDCPGHCTLCMESTLSCKNNNPAKKSHDPTRYVRFGLKTTPYPCPDRPRQKLPSPFLAEDYDLDGKVLHTNQFEPAPMPDRPVAVGNGRNADESEEESFATTEREE